jgi:hypothetical protein
MSLELDIATTSPAVEAELSYLVPTAERPRNYADAPPGLSAFPVKVGRTKRPCRALTKKLGEAERTRKAQLCPPKFDPGRSAD